MQTATDAENDLWTQKGVLSSYFRAYQNQCGPLLAYSESVMGSDSPLTMAEKFMLAAFTSELNRCHNCRNIQERAAITCGVDEGVLQALLTNIDTAPLTPKCRQLFHYAKKIALTPWEITEHDSNAIFSFGWSKKALADVVAIVGLFSLWSRIVEGLQLQSPEHTHRESGIKLATGGFTAMAKDHGLTAPFASLVSEDGIEAPSNFSVSDKSLQPGQEVILRGLKKQCHNGKKGRVLEFVPHAGNWRVELENAIVLRVDASNCIVPGGEESDDDYPPLSEAPSSAEIAWEGGMMSAGSSIASGGVSHPPQPPPPPPQTLETRKRDLARTRFVRVQERMAKEFAAADVLQNVTVKIEDKTEQVFFTINSKWDKGRKALFAKSYTRLYKDGTRKLRVLILDKDDGSVEEIPELGT
eukprot:TRINITY_DN1333_c0_g1_i2.p1 TRINITY_DN1333_c0_g1~~TRINITY_DN1333_c0_g1_i2.p1  ORF type:complete len:413 (+),score=76.76 TRINITY_DN1333_c0_g1_i2:55-1293(+)